MITQAMSRTIGALACMAVAAGLCACEARTFTITVGQGGGAGGTGGTGGTDQPSFDANFDNDAPMNQNGDAGPFEGDAGPTADVAPCSPSLETDPSNCGKCGMVCSFANALPTCGQAQCGFEQCLPGFVNLDNISTNGCEYKCTVTMSGTEACDAIDNDCDGMTDEETAFTTDLMNCGACKRECKFLNAGASCANSECVLGACTQGFVNANGNATDGCECAQTNNGVEICDGIDNDCNGMVDDVAGQNQSTDVQHCGSCNRNCTTLPQAIATCEMGMCVVKGCSFGFSNADGMAANGCEVACPGGFEGGTEVCDNVDNDCDGKTDAADPSMVAVNNFCRTAGECFGAKPVCQSGGWVCSYTATVELTAPNQVIGNETRCDGKDNDCDGCIDESFPQVGPRPAANGASCQTGQAQACADEKKGQCQGKGVFECAAAGNGVSCKIQTPGQAATTELCDNLDNNCDGITDNSLASDAARIKDIMVPISGGGVTGTVYVDAYEASRPDATASKPGVSQRRSCSKAGAIPWVNIGRADAQAACVAAGKRLCTEQEWQRACQTTAATACTWAFATACTTPATDTCNVYERDGNANLSGDQDVMLTTGALASCNADWAAAGKIYDLTGNVREWTQPRSAGKNPLRGGSYDTVLDGSRCDFTFLAVSDTFRYENSGFRCCSNTAP